MPDAASREAELARIRARVGGEYEVSLEVFYAGDRPNTPTPVADFVSSAGGGYTLRELRARIGGQSGYIMGPEGKRYLVSLKPWEGANPDLTHLIVRFRFVPKDAILFSQLVQEFVQNHGEDSGRP